jgi:hypothetical protein
MYLGPRREPQQSHPAIGGEDGCGVRAAFDLGGDLAAGLEQTGVLEDRGGGGGCEEGLR